MSLARSADLEVVISNTTEAGISYHAGDKLEDRPPTPFLPRSVLSCMSASRPLEAPTTVACCSCLWS